MATYKYSAAPRTPAKKSMESSKADMAKDKKLGIKEGSSKDEKMDANLLKAAKGKK